MNTVCLLGSPRRDGNSDCLANVFIEKAQQHGAQVSSFALSSLSYNGCINLFECKNRLDHCGQTDDLTPVLNAIASADVLVLASPVYFTGLSGQLKLAIDRMFSFFVPDYTTAQVKSRLSPGRHLVLIQTQGEPRDRYANLLDSHSAGFTGLGFEHQHLIRAWGVCEPGEVSQHAQFIAQCGDVADRVYC